MIQVTGLAEIVLEVRDLEAAGAFYEEVIGLTLHKWNDRVWIAEGEGFRVHLRAYGTPGHRGASAFHFAFTVPPDELDAAAERLEAGGLLHRRGDFGEGGRAVFCFDPDQNEVEFLDYYARADASGATP